MAKKARTTTKKTAKKKAVTRTTNANKIVKKTPKKVSVRRLSTVEKAELADADSSAKVTKKARTVTTKKISAKKTPAAEIKKSTPALKKASVAQKPAALKPPKKASAEVLDLDFEDFKKKTLAEVEVALQQELVEEAPLIEPSPLASIFVDRGKPLPDTYGMDRMVALVRDPQWVFCYWELSGSVLNEVKSTYGEQVLESSAWVLRLYRIDDDLAVDLEIDPSIGNWYLHVGAPGYYQLELGLLTPDGLFISLVCSQEIGTPSERPSEVYDERWRMREEDEKLFLGRLLEEYGLARLQDQTQRSSRFKEVIEFNIPSSAIFSRSALPSSFIGASWSGVSSAFSVSGSWSAAFLGASKLPSSPGSGGFMNAVFVVGLDGRQEPVLIRPSFNGGPNWHFQANLPRKTGSKTDAPHFKVKLPRIQRGLKRPRPSWPPTNPYVASFPQSMPYTPVVPSLPERPALRLKSPKPVGSSRMS